jgi:hypothetical protein
MLRTTWTVFGLNGMLHIYPLSFVPKCLDPSNLVPGALQLVIMATLYACYCHSLTSNSLHMFLNQQTLLPGLTIGTSVLHRLVSYLVTILIYLADLPREALWLLTLTRPR